MEHDDKVVYLNWLVVWKCGLTMVYGRYNYS